MFWNLTRWLEKLAYNKMNPDNPIPDDNSLKNNSVLVYTGLEAAKEVKEEVKEAVTNNTALGFLSEFWNFAKNNALIVLAAFFGLYFLKKL